LITWGGPPLPPKLGKNRVYLEVAPLDQAELDAEVDRLVALGAARVDIGQSDVDWVVMADPDSNELRLAARVVGDVQPRRDPR